MSKSNLVPLPIRTTALNRDRLNEILPRGTRNLLFNQFIDYLIIDQYPADSEFHNEFIGAVQNRQIKFTINW